jgi:hypothetical protein
MYSVDSTSNSGILEKQPRFRGIKKEAREITGPSGSFQTRDGIAKQPVERPGRPRRSEVSYYRAYLVIRDAGSYGGMHVHVHQTGGYARCDAWQPSECARVASFPFFSSKAILYG